MTGVSACTKSSGPGSFSLSKPVFVAAALLIALTTFLVYIPALRNGFVNFDDQLYVYENSSIRSIDSQFFNWLLTAVVSSNWHPLTMLSLALDYAGWGLNPFGYHLTNVLFHSLNTFLVFILVMRLIECTTHPSSFILHPSSLIAASITALLFGIHPLHIESVAWVSERKDVLCAFFYLLSLLAYIRYASVTGLKYYVLSLVFFSLALLSKPMAVSLPIVLLMLDYYSFNRFTAKGGMKNIKWVLLEKLPFVLLTLSFSLITIWVQETEGSIVSLDQLPIWVRILVVGRGYIFYIVKMFMPLNLAPFYPYPTYVLTIEYIGSLILSLTITIFALLSAKKKRLFSAAWLYYIVTLLPAIGIIQVGGQAAADRYTYLPSLGPFFLIGMGIGTLLKIFSQKEIRATIITTLVFLITILFIITENQITVWHDSVIFWSHEIKFFPIDRTYIYRGEAYNKLGNYQQAIKDFTKAIELNPKSLKAYNDRGEAYSRLGYYQQAIKDFTKAIELNPISKKAYNDRGVNYKNLGNYNQAMEDLNKAILLDPQNPAYYHNLGSVYLRIGDFEKARICDEKALSLNRQKIPPSSP